MLDKLRETSFRDPSGFVYIRNGVLYRQVNRVFARQFDALIASGLYDDLRGLSLLVEHEVASIDHAATRDAHCVIRPERLDLISYPYEWSFGQLKDAALLTLTAQERALARGFTLRDASAYNVQFRDGRPVFIDTLSFEPYEEGKPWSAYKQFCEHFLIPLLLMSRRDIRCGELLRCYLDGIPLDLGSALLPPRSWLSISTLIHVHIHARATRRYSNASVDTVLNGRVIRKAQLQTIVNSLRTMIDGLSWRAADTQWANYTSDNNYNDTATRSKRELVAAYLRQANPRTVWDLGANTGEYSRIARQHAALVVAFDADPAAVELHYRQLKQSGIRGILPLLVNLMNPSPAQGWAHGERMSFGQRGPADAVMALALIHHLAISNNVPLPLIAEFFARLSDFLIVEFVPKSDSQVKRLLLNRLDIFDGYTQPGFERAFGAHFDVLRSQRVEDSERTLYLMRRHYRADAA